MAFIDAIRRLNRWKQRRLIRDYAIIGAVAATAYIEPRQTHDLDVVILVDTDEEYRQTFQALADEAESVEGKRLVIDGVPVQVFPSTVMPLYRDAVENARKVRMGSSQARVAPAEHLVLLSLLANRDWDGVRVRQLMLCIDEARLNSLLRRFDDAEHTLAARLAELRGPSVPRKGAMASPPGAAEL